MSGDVKILEYVTSGRTTLDLPKGQVVVVRAVNAPEGQKFKEWKIELVEDETQTPDTTVDKVNEPVARVTMGSKPATIKAVFEINETGEETGSNNTLTIESGSLYEIDTELESTIKDLEKQLENIKSKLSQEKSKVSQHFQERDKKDSSNGGSASTHG